MLTTDPIRALSGLGDRFEGVVTRPGDAGFDDARRAFNLTIDQRPAAVACPRSATEAAEVVAAARDAGLRIAPQGSGHNAGPLGGLSDTVIVKLERLTGVEIDAGDQRARVEAGARWWDVVPAAGEFGLSALHGSSPEINVVGYSLGGGVGWQARKRGLQANSVTAAEIVTADGELRRIDSSSEPDLFWAIRGGGGNFGLVTAIEFCLYPLAEVYAGLMFFPYERSAEVFHAWREWTAMVPDEVTSAMRMMQFPDLEEVPELVRGKSFAIFNAAYLGGEEDGFELTRPMRALCPEIDTFATVPASALTALHLDPLDPMPYVTDHSLIDSLPAKAVDELMEVAGPGTDSPLFGVELRHTGGALSRAPEGAGAVSTLAGSYLTFAGAPVMAPETVPMIEAHLALVAKVYEPHDCGRYLNFTEERDDVSRMFPAGTPERLARVKRDYDPEGLFRANHEIAPAQSS
jgi:FAD/FMN-containing dehydrogenase